jgi:hypothetical protein
MVKWKISESKKVLMWGQNFTQIELFKTKFVLPLFTMALHTSHQVILLTQHRVAVKG